MKQYSLKSSGAGSGVASRTSNAVPNSGDKNSRLLTGRAESNQPSGAASSGSTFDTTVHELKGPVGEPKGVTGKNRYMSATPGESGAHNIGRAQPLRTVGAGLKDINTLPPSDKTASARPRRSGRKL